MSTLLRIIPIAIAALAVTVLILSSGINDIDADGVLDKDDNCPDVSNPTQENFDLDDFGNECDVDDDNDGINDEIDIFDENSSEWADFDFDGLGTTQDTDDDNDGISDEIDPTPILYTEKLTLDNLDKIKNCSETKNGTSRLLCYSEFFGDLTKQEDNNKNALDLALTLNKIGAVDDCHFVSHEIGHVAFNENPNVYDNLVIMDSSVCRGGFYHGILAAYFHDLKENNAKFPDSYKTICDDFIGTYNYNHCLHGLGHGVVHYYMNDLKSSIKSCDELSYYQNDLCLSGVMMQYTDNEITVNGMSKEMITSLCSKSELNSYDYLKCTTTIGVTLAFHTNHNLQESTKFCKMIDEQDGQEYCIVGLQQEMDKAKKVESTANEEQLGILQSKWIKQEDKKWIVDFRSPATISEFVYDKNTMTMQFEFDMLAEIRIYAWSGLLSENSVITIDGISEDNTSIKKTIDGDYFVIRILPSRIGDVMISPA
ncbi:MAG TPA: thrombospondin type 3 repeat-containing protein [Nitrosopumilaceae archaeon]|nr:thrombospondin type 3 repeat-containing protein [Nitrosopumilaceae archaeon]